MDLKELKARMLCEGVNADETATEMFQQQNPSGTKRGGLSSGAKMELILMGHDHTWFHHRYFQPEERLRINAPLYHKRKTDIRVTADHPGKRALTVYCNSSEVMRAEAIPAPAWYGEKVGEFDVTQILTEHGNQLAGAVYEDCVLFGLNEQCQFCVMNRSLTRKSPELTRKSAELFVNALKNIPLANYHGLSLNGGMTLHAGRGIEVIEPAVKTINRAFPNLPIAVEITPPEDTSWIGRLADAGVSSMMMNLECWDPQIRAQLLPGKNKYCPQAMYFQAFEYALKVMRRGSVSTCFVVGTEPTVSLKEGIKKVVEMGVIPSPLAGRYFEDVPNYPFTPNAYWRDFMDIMEYTSSEMRRCNLCPTDKAGCVACGMCDMISDMSL